MNEVEMSILASQMAEADAEPKSELTILAAKVLLHHLQVIKNNLPIVEQSLKELSLNRGTEEDINNVRVLLENMNFAVGDHAGEHFYD